MIAVSKGSKMAAPGLSPSARPWLLHSDGRCVSLRQGTEVPVRAGACAILACNRLCWTVDFNNKACVSIRLRQAVSHFVRVVAWVWKVRYQLSCVVVYRWSRTQMLMALLNVM